MEKKKRKIQFFKVLVGNFLDHLCMPPDFVHQVIEELPSHVLLKTNSQRVSPVELLKTNDGVFFGGGWKEFVEYHNLQEEEFLVFTYYSGKEYLKVRVFATTGFERKVVFEEVKPEEVKEKVQKPCMRVNMCNSSFPKRRISLRSLEKEFVRSKDLPANASSHGMTYQRRNPEEEKVVQSGNCFSPATKLHENEFVTACGVKKKILTYCVNDVPTCSESSACYESSDVVEDEHHLKRQKIMRNENETSPVIEISDSETIAGDVNDNYCTRKCGTTMSSVESDYFDFVVKAERVRPCHFRPLYIPSSFFCKHLCGIHQVKICYGNDRDGDDFLVLKNRPNGGTIRCFTSFCKHNNVNVGDKCRFEHVSGPVFKVWKISGESGL